MVNVLKMPNNVNLNWFLPSISVNLKNTHNPVFLLKVFITDYIFHDCLRKYSDIKLVNIPKKTDIGLNL